MRRATGAWDGRLARSLDVTPTNSLQLAQIITIDSFERLGRRACAQQGPLCSKADVASAAIELHMRSARRAGCRAPI